MAGGQFSAEWYEQRLIEQLDKLEGHYVLKKNPKGGGAIPEITVQGIDPDLMLKYGKQKGHGNGLYFGADAKFDINRVDKNKRLQASDIEAMNKAANNIKTRITNLLYINEYAFNNKELDASVSYNNLLFGFIASTYDHEHYMTADEKSDRVRDAFGDGRGNPARGMRLETHPENREGDISNYRRHIFSLNDAERSRVLGNNFIEIDNPYVYRDLNTKICDGVRDIFTSTDTHILARVSGETVLPDIDPDTGNPARAFNSKLAVNRETTALVAELQKQYPGLVASNPHILDDFERLTREYAMASVAPMLAQCIECPEFCPHTGYLLDSNGKPIDPAANPTQTYDAAAKMFKEHMSVSVNKPHDEAWKNLQAFLVHNGIEAGKLKPNRGGSTLDFEDMLSFMTRGYFAGYVQVNQGLMHYLDPVKMNTYMPTPIKIQDAASGVVRKTTHWEEMKRQWGEENPQVDTTLHPDQQDSHSRSLKQTKKLQRAAEAGGRRGRLNRFPHRGLFKLYAKCQKLTQQFMGSFQQAGYLMRFMETQGFMLNERTTPTHYDLAMRDNIKTCTNLDFLHAEQVALSNLPGGSSTSAVDKYLDTLAQIREDEEIDDQKNSIDILNGKLQGSKTKTGNIDINKDNEQKFKDLVAHYAGRMTTNAGREAVRQEFVNAGMSSANAANLVKLITHYSKPFLAQCQRDSIREEQGLERLFSEYGEKRQKEHIKTKAAGSRKSENQIRIDNAMAAYRASGNPAIPMTATSPRTPTTRDAATVMNAIFPKDGRGGLNLDAKTSLDTTALDACGWAVFVERMEEQYTSAEKAVADAAAYTAAGSPPRDAYRGPNVTCPVTGRIITGSPLPLGDAEAMEKFSKIFERELKNIISRYLGGQEREKEALKGWQRGD